MLYLWSYKSSFKELPMKCKLEIMWNDFFVHSIKKKSAEKDELLIIFEQGSACWALTSQLE